MLVIGLAYATAACTKPNADNTPPTVANAANSNVSPAPPADTHAQHPEDKMPRVRVDAAKKLVDEGKAVIIDVRGTESYKLGHIKGSLDHVLNKIEAGDFKGLPKDKGIIAYCT